MEVNRRYMFLKNSRISSHIPGLPLPSCGTLLYAQRTSEGFLCGPSAAHWFLNDCFCCSNAGNGSCHEWGYAPKFNRYDFGASHLHLHKRGGYQHFHWHDLLHEHSCQLMRVQEHSCRFLRAGLRLTLFATEDCRI